MVKVSQSFGKNEYSQSPYSAYFFLHKKLPADMASLSQSAGEHTSYAAVRFLAVSANGRYLALSFIQCSARLLALAISLSGKVTNGTRVGPTLQ
jgi:hypothetical protein